MAINDITGDVIKSKIPTQGFRDNYDIAFKRQTAHKWLEEVYGTNAQFEDTEGWDIDNTDPLKKISRNEFMARCGHSRIKLN
jgi:hypothetical protein